MAEVEDGEHTGTDRRVRRITKYGFTLNYLGHAAQDKKKMEINDLTGHGFSPRLNINTWKEHWI